MPVDPGLRQQRRAWIESDDGGNARLVNKVEVMSEGGARIPFLSPMLTWATGGGMHVGHFGRLYGVEGSGKSLTIWGLIYCAQNYPRIVTEQYEREIRYWEQRNKINASRLKKQMKSMLKRFPDGMSVMIFDTEQRAMEDFGTRLGIDMHPDKVAIYDHNIIEEIVNEIKGATDAYHLFVIDSASNAMSIAEANLEPGEYERGTSAAAWKRLRQVRRTWDRRENTLILVDQMRVQLGQGMPGRPSPVRPPQSRFLKHNISLEIEFARGTQLYLRDNGVLTTEREKASNNFRALGTDGKQVAGLEMRCRIEKNSTGAPYRNATMRFKQDVLDPPTGELVQEMGFDIGYELLQIAEYFHIIESGGGGMFYLLDDNFKRDSVKWKGEFKAIADILDNDELQNRIQTVIQLRT